jgi:hypothetical protein
MNSTNGVAGSRTHFSVPLDNGQCLMVSVSGPKDDRRLGQIVYDTLRAMGQTPLEAVIDLEGSDYEIVRHE